MIANFYNWLSTFLKDRGFQYSRSGFKGGQDIGRHTIDEFTGFWGDVPYSSGKPPRWLFQVEASGAKPVARLPNGLVEIFIGASNTAQGDKAGLAVRILPLIKLGTDSYRRIDDFEINALFLFHGALTAGSSSDGFLFNPNTGEMKRLGQPEDYIFAAMMGIRPRTDAIKLSINGVDRALTYGEIIDSVAAAVTIRPKGRVPSRISIYDASEASEIDRLKADLLAAWDAAGPAPVPVTAGNPVEDAEPYVDDLDYVHSEIPENPELVGIDPSVYRQINAMLKSGKQHLMLYGPPGTGKTSLARWIAQNLPGGNWTLITGSADWSSQDIIGGYQPLGEGNVDFVPGILLREFRKPLIIDEMNRCDIDKVIGPLFTVLSGQQTTLPYRIDIADKNSQQYVILPKPKAAPAPHEFAPGPGWRIIATINSIDKASLYQMSYALTRRFGWVYVDAPRDLALFVRDYLARMYPGEAQPALGASCPLADLWAAINAVRVIGPAPIIDTIGAMRAIDPSVEFFGPANAAARSGVLDALDMVILPMLDGIVQQDAAAIAGAAITAFSLDPVEQAWVTARLNAVAI